MSEQTIDQAPTQFRLSVPTWWPHVRRITDPGDATAQQIAPEHREALGQLMETWGDGDGTQLVAVITNVAEDRQGIGVMYVNHSAKAGQLLSGLVGVEANRDQVPALSSIGKLDDTEVSVLDIDSVGPVSCVTTHRGPSDPDADPRGGLLRIYVIPQPHTMRAVMILFVTVDDPQLRTPFFEMCDSVVSTFGWID